MSLVISHTNDIRTPEYRNHRIFKDLSRYIAFYDSLSFSATGWLQSGIQGGGLMLEAHIYASMQGTLESIRLILRKGRINDGYALLRKYNDAAIIDVYANVYLQENFSLDNMIVEKINKWVRGDEPLPWYDDMRKYIKASSKVKPITDLLSKDIYDTIRTHCNDHTHYNFFHYLQLNDKDLYQDRLQPLNDFADDLENLFIMHLAYIFYLNPHFMVSSEYLDFQDMGQTPPEDSQYWVASFVQEIFNKVIKPKHPDIAAAIKQGTSMHLQ